MVSFLYSLNATVPIFLVMIVGWVIKQIGVIDDHFANVANKYVFKVALPVLLFRDLAAADFKSQFDVKFVLYCMIVTTIMFSGIWICTEIFMKDDTQKGAFVRHHSEAVRRYWEWHSYRICTRALEWHHL